MSPYLFTADPQKAPAILEAIASNGATTQFAQILTQSWTDADPLSDSAVQAAGQHAVLSVVQALLQPNSTKGA